MGLRVMSATALCEWFVSMCAQRVLHQARGTMHGRLRHIQTTAMFGTLGRVSCSVGGCGGAGVLARETRWCTLWCCMCNGACRVHAAPHMEGATVPRMGWGGGGEGGLFAFNSLQCTMHSWWQLLVGSTQPRDSQRGAAVTSQTLAHNMHHTVVQLFEIHQHCGGAYGVGVPGPHRLVGGKPVR